MKAIKRFICVNRLPAVMNSVTDAGFTQRSVTRYISGKKTPDRIGHLLTNIFPGGSPARLLFRPQTDFGPVRLVGLGDVSRRPRQPEVQVRARETRGRSPAPRQTQRV